MRNITWKKEGSHLIIKIDTTQNLGPSKSGKTTMVATTGGNMPIPNGDEILKLGLNLYK